MRTTQVTDKETISTLLAIVKNNYGFDIGQVTSSSRLQLHVVCRQVMSNIARIEKNMHPQIIAACLNKDRTSILSYFNKHDTYYSTWKVYRDTFDKIYEDYCRLKQKRKLFQNEKDLRSYLIDSGVKFSENPSIFITVKMENFVVCINTDYRNFSFNSELIRLALIDYDCKIEINFENETSIK